MSKKAKSFEAFLVEYIAGATVEQTQTALNFFNAIAGQKIATASPAAVKAPKAPKASKIQPTASSTTVTLAAAA